MSENEKKVHEMNENELEEIAGGRQYAGSPVSGIRTLTCSECGTSYKVSINALKNASCPNCGNKETE